MYISMYYDLWIEVCYNYCENDIEAKFYMKSSMVMSRTITKKCTDMKPLKF
jgi:hypothetical protein